MTKDKAENTAVRARMAKTGVWYTMARHYHLEQHVASPADARLMKAPAPDNEFEPERMAVTEPDMGPTPMEAAGSIDFGLSDIAVRRATGKSRDQWFGLLDAWDGVAKTHAGIARYLHEAHGIDGWWAQGVTVGYERARGMRVRHQTPDVHRERQQDRSGPGHNA